jgi:phage terminase large subunit
MDINKAYIKFIKSEARTCVLMGGAGSGKSFASAQKIIMRIVSTEGVNVLVIRKVAKTLRNSVHEQLRKIIEMEGLTEDFLITTTPLEITCNRNGNKIIFIGLDDPEKIKSIANITHIWVEEATELNKEDFDQIKLRVRGITSSYKQIVLTFNPISSLHWLKKEFFDKVNDDTLVLTTTYRDNKFLTKDDRKTIEDLKYTNPMAYDVYANAQWGVITEALIYNNWSVKPDINEDETWYDEILAGADFGYHHPAALKIGLDKEGNIYVLKEVKLNKVTRPEFFAEIDKVFGKKDMIIADSEDPASIEEMKKEGFIVKPVIKTKDLVKMGIDYINRRKIFVHPSCVNFINEIQTYSWTKDEKSGYYIDKPVKINDHLMDCLRYAMTEKMNRKEIKACLGFSY